MPPASCQVMDLGSVALQEAINRIELAAKTATPIPDIFEAGGAAAPAPDGTPDGTKGRDRI